MSTFKYKIGYCGHCIANVEHRRSLRSPFFPGFDVITFRAFKIFGVGPWYCIGCGNKRLILAYARRNAARYELRQEDADEVSEVERVGNYLRTDLSLVDQSTRKSRFTQKFRDGIALRVVSGRSSLTKTANDLGVKKIDVEIWIKDLRQREMGQRMDGLKSTVEGNLPNRIGLIDDHTDRSDLSEAATNVDSENRSTS